MKAKVAVNKADDYVNDIKAELKQKIADAKQICMDELKFITNKYREKRKLKQETRDKLNNKQ